MYALKLLLALVMLLAAGLVPVLSQDKKEPAAGTEMDAWAKAHAPNANHKLLEKLAGNWMADVTFVFNPKEKPELNKMAVKREMVMGGRFLYESYDLWQGSMPHEGRGYIGYNNSKKTFQMIHIESMNTALEVTDGTWDEKTQTLSFPSGPKEMEWGGNKVKFTMTMSFTIESEDKHTFSMKTKYEQMPDEIEEVKIVYTRRK